MPEVRKITHQMIDQRLYRLVACCVERIDAEPSLLHFAKEAVSRQPNPRIKAEWEQLLKMDWPTLRERLLERSQRGDQLRQNAPFGRILTVRERKEVFTSDARSA